MDKQNMFLSNYPMENMVIDYSGYLMGIVLVLVCIYIVWFLINKKRVKKKKTNKQLTLEKIQNLNFDSKEHKQLAYDFTLLIKSYLEQKDEKFEEILKELEVYKYHKNPQKIDINIINKMKRFINELE